MTRHLLTLLSCAALITACNGDDGPANASDSNTGSGTETDTMTGSGSSSVTDSNSGSGSGSATDTIGTASNSGGSGTDSSGSGSATDSGGSGSTSATGSSSATATTTATGSSSATATGTSTVTATGSGTAVGSSGGATTGGAIPCPNGNADCDNNLPCDGVETCVAGFCEAGIPMDCDDNIVCTVDTCDDNMGMCVHLTQDTLCSDGQFCTGIETCDPPNGDPTTGCVAGQPPDCGDAHDCTIDSCNEALNQCDHVPDHGDCDNTLHCDGVEICDVNMGCIDGPDPDCNDGLACTTDSCNEGTDSCDHVADDAECDDGVFCDGDEVCTLGVGCEEQADVNCVDDGYTCTVESCSEMTMGCETVADNGLCPNGQFCVPADPGADPTTGCVAAPPCNVDADCDDNDACNGDETCNGTTCEPGTPVDCNDNVACTFDSCNPANGMCSHTAQDGACNDNNLCTTDTCDEVTGCSNTMINCDDGVACTSNDCLPQFGCSNVGDDAFCQNIEGNFCDGDELCLPNDQNADGNGCVAGTPVTCTDDGIACTVESCNEATDQCESNADDSLCMGCGETCDPNQGCGDYCNVATCQGKVYQCGDCLDNDMDCDMPGGGIDSQDSNCFGPCDNNENGLKGEIPGQDGSDSCGKMDCYFDQDNGSGNDDCFWAHSCDPLEPATPENPNNNQICDYDANTNFPGGKGCTDYDTMQSQACLDFCGPLVPNGCDCFGCCEVSKDLGSPCTQDSDCVATGTSETPDPEPSNFPTTGTCDVMSGLCSYTVFLGTNDKAGAGTCDIDSVDNYDACHPCTQVPSCFNDCAECEVCLGKPDIPDSCTPDEQCPGGEQPCGQQGQAQCPAGWFCITGCCIEGG